MLFNGQRSNVALVDAICYTMIAYIHRMFIESYWTATGEQLKKPNMWGCNTARMQLSLVSLPCAWPQRPLCQCGNVHGTSAWQHDQHGYGAIWSHMEPYTVDIGRLYRHVMNLDELPEKMMDDGRCVLMCPDVSWCVSVAEMCWKLLNGTTGLAQKQLV